MNSVRSNNVSLKYQRPTLSGCKDIGIGKFEFVAKTQFLFGSKFLKKFQNFESYMALQNMYSGAQ